MARGEIHVQLAVNYSEDPKLRALARFGRDARGCRDLYVQMLCYCKRNLTDGYVPIEEVGVLVYPDAPKAGIRDADRLVEVGLARPVEGGYLMPGFLKRNKSKAQVDAESTAKAEAGRKGGKRSGQVRRGEATNQHFGSDGEADAKHLASVNEAEMKQGASDCLNTEVIGHRSETKTVPPSAGAAAPHLELVLVDATTVQATTQTKVRDEPGGEPDPDTAQTILGEYIDRCRKRPPKSVVGQMAKHIKELLDQDFEPNIVRQGIAQWMTKELHPSVLPSIVNSLANRTASTGTDGYQPYQNPTDQSDYDQEY